MKVMKGVMILLLASTTVAAQERPPMRISLPAAERLAFLGSDDLRLSELEVRAAEERFRLEARDWLPQLEIALTSQAMVNRLAPDSSADELRLTLEQPIYNGGRTVAQRTLARLKLAISRHSVKAARAEMLTTLWEQFHLVLALEAKAAVKRDYLEQSRRQLEIVRTERAVGVARELDLVDSELQVSNLELDLRATESGLVEAEFALKKSLSLPPDREIELDGAIDPGYDGVAIDFTPATLLELAEAGNVDLEAARYRVTEAETQASLARSRYLPRVSASLSLTLSGERLPLSTPGFSLGIAVAFPEAEAPAEANIAQGATGSDSRSRTSALTIHPLQSLSGLADETDARLALERARAGLASLRREVGFQIAEGIVDYRRQQEGVRLERRSIDLERRKLNIMQMELARGLVTRIDLLKEELAASDLESRHLESILTLMRSEWSIERLVGLDPGGLARASAARRPAAEGRDAR